LLDENKYNIIVEKYQKQILYYCTWKYSIVLPDAEEIVNDVFMILFQKWGTLEFDDIKAWLYRTTDNLVMHHFRKNKVRIKAESLYDNDSEEFVINDCEKEIIFEDFVSRIFQILSNEDQKIFEYRFITGLALKEISEMMNIPYSTVRFRLMEIKNKISVYLL